MQTELWKDIPDYIGFYQISNWGRIKSLSRKYSPKERILEPYGKSDQYKRLHLSKNGIIHPVLIHILVAEAFLGPCPNGYQVNHIDGNKANPRLDNLEYVTPQGNIQHSFAIGLHKRGEQHRNAKIKSNDVIDIRNARANGTAIRALSNQYGLSESAIKDIIHRRNWKHV